MTEKTTQKTPVTYVADGDIIDRVIDWLRRSNRPQSSEAITRRYIELLREAAGFK